MVDGKYNVAASLFYNRHSPYIKFTFKMPNDDAVVAKWTAAESSSGVDSSFSINCHNWLFDSIVWFKDNAPMSYRLMEHFQSVMMIANTKLYSKSTHD